MTTGTVKRRRAATPEQLAAAEERRAGLRRMAAEIAALSDAERAAIVARLGRCVTVEGHALSVRNACLVWFQRPDASVVAGFRQWLAAGRAVRKGEHGIGIWAPTGGRDGDEGDEGPRFVFVTVFDVAQTEAVAS